MTVQLPDIEALLLSAVKDLVVDRGTSSGAAPVGNNALTDSTKSWAAGVHRNRLIRIIKGSGVGQLRVVSDNSSGTLLITGTWVVGLDATSEYVILEKDAAQILRDVFGGGADIDAANPLPVDVVGVPFAVPVPVDVVEVLDSDSEVGATGNAYATVLDWDTRGLDEMTLYIKNTGGVNSLDYELLTRSVYAGMDYTKIPETTLAPAAMDEITLEGRYARIIVRVKSTTPDNSTNYQIDYIGAGE